jgi:hypothetical protein
MDEVILRATEAVAGALGGLAAGTGLKSLDFGKVGDGVVGLIGGLIGTYLLSSTFPGLASMAGSGSVGGLAGGAVVAFFSGAVLLGICALSKDLLSTKT